MCPSPPRQGAPERAGGLPPPQGACPRGCAGASSARWGGASSARCGGLVFLHGVLPVAQRCTLQSMSCPIPFAPSQNSTLAHLHILYQLDLASRCLHSRPKKPQRVTQCQHTPWGGGIPADLRRAATPPPRCGRRPQHAVDHPTNWEAFTINRLTTNRILILCIGFSAAMASPLSLQPAAREAQACPIAAPPRQRLAGWHVTRDDCSSRWRRRAGRWAWPQCCTLLHSFAPMLQSRALFCECVPRVEPMHLLMLQVGRSCRAPAARRSAATWWR